MLKGRGNLIKYVLFDLDGTLTNPKEGITKCVQHALRHFGIERECDELTSFIGPPLKEQFMKYASLSEEDAIEAVRVYRERFAPIGLFENQRKCLSTSATTRSTRTGSGVAAAAV